MSLKRISSKFCIERLPKVFVYKNLLCKTAIKQFAYKNKIETLFKILKCVAFATHFSFELGYNDNKEIRCSNICFVIVL